MPYAHAKRVVPANRSKWPRADTSLAGGMFTFGAETAGVPI